MTDNNQALVYVVIPNWNGQALLADVLNSLLKQTYQNFKVVVVDNGSSDDSVAFIKQHYPQVEALELAKNYGFSGGVNAGIKHALAKQAKFVALFNNDAMAEPTWLAELVKRIESNSKIGIVTGKFMQFPKQKIFDSTGDQYSIWGLPFPRGRDEQDHGQYNKAEFVTSASGGASLYRADLFNDIGLFDEDFFAYYEDVDISLRAQLQGWKIYYEPAAVAYHRLGATSSKLGDFTRYHSIKNNYYLYIKNMPLKLFFKYLPRFTAVNAMIVVNCVRRLKLKVLLLAYLRLLITLPKMFYLRLHIQKQSHINSQDFDALLYRSIPPTNNSLRRLKKLFEKK